jgi:hypothetical protein
MPKKVIKARIFLSSVCTSYPLKPYPPFQSSWLLHNKIPISEENMIVGIVFLREGIVYHG